MANRKFLMNKWVSVICTSLCFSHISLFAQQNKTAADNYFEISKNLELTTNIYKELNEYYVDPIEPGRMLKTSLDAMLKELDPYTVYISESEIEDHRMLSSGQYGGIGINMFKNKNADFVFEDPIEDGPAYKAGIRSGDILVDIDGRNVNKLSLEEVALLFRGAPNTTINIKTKHPIDGTFHTRSIKRSTIEISTVRFASLLGKDKKMAYVNLAQFTPDCSKMVRLALDSLKTAAGGTLSGVVLDLRNNPGGLLDEAVNLCNLFIDKGQVVVTTKGNSTEWDKSFVTLNNPWDLLIPVTVLINNQSASASEIVAGTIQDLDRGIVIGQRSFGKGLVQVIKNIGYNAKLKLTTAKYYTPSGRCIQSTNYSIKHSDGSVHSIPDSLKQLFKTKKGRSVYDGGGVEPDINILQGKNTALISSLVSNKVIFNYATHYFYKNKTIAPASAYTFTLQDFEDFKKWLITQNVNFESASESKLQELKSLLKTEQYDASVLNMVQQLEQQVNKAKLTEIDNHRKEIISLLNKEIVTRYYAQKGAVENSLNKNDEAIERAIEVLQNETTYKKILN